jgi:hypothetical protein
LKRRAFIYGWPLAVLAVVAYAGLLHVGAAVAVLILLELGVAFGEGTHPPPPRSSGKLVDLTGRRPK